MAVRQLSLVRKKNSHNHKCTLPRKDDVALAIATQSGLDVIAVSDVCCLFLTHPSEMSWPGRNDWVCRLTFEKSASRLYLKRQLNEVWHRGDWEELTYRYLLCKSSLAFKWWTWHLSKQCKPQNILCVCVVCVCVWLVMRFSETN